jgi:ketosteroid isomerase-like protein
VVVNGDGSLHDRAAALARFAQPTFATSMTSFPVGKVTVRRFGDVALIHAENAYELKDGRKGVSRYTDIWHQRDGRWLCIAAHITVHKAPLVHAGR